MKFIPKYQSIFVGVSLIFELTIFSSALNEYSSYRRYPLCQPSQAIRYPKSIQDVVNIVTEARMRGLKVKAFGVRHSQTDIICTDGIPVDVTGLAWIRMNADRTVTVGAGTNMHDTTRFLRTKGRGFKTTPAYGNITIGGAIGTGAHGSTIKYHASISEQVVSVKIVNGLGQIQVVTDPEDMKAFKLHLGLLGIVVEVTLNTVELYKTRAFNYVVSDDILTDGRVVNIARTTDQVSLYWFPEYKEVVVANWTIVDKNTPGNDYTNDHVPSMYENMALIAAFAKEVAFSLTESTCAVANTLGYTILHVYEYLMESALLMPVPDWVPIYATQNGTFKNPAVGYYDEMFAPICYDEPQGVMGAACVWSHGVNSITILDNEFGIDLDKLGDFVRDVKDIISKTPTAFPDIGILMRFSGASDIYMSTAYVRETCHFEFYLWNRDDIYNRPSGSLAGYQTILQTLSKKYKARSHWGKNGMVYHSSPMIDLKMNETARQGFIRVMNKYDPKETFINDFGRRIKRTGTKMNIDPLTKHCALLDNCFCSINSDCGANQVCTTVKGYTYNVCKTRNEVVPIPTLKTKLPKPLDIVPWLVSVVPTLVMSAVSNCSLADKIGIVAVLLPGVLRVDKALSFAFAEAKTLGKLSSLGDIVGAVGDTIKGLLNG